jgi:hypothetical protein|tara:strand:+ start:247 stop:1005 length:759 start_codon:yes stop_codon:yes gene_type:complete
MVNVNTVYTTILYILNKEQRGYITPPEFNSLAEQVQEEIFQSYFPDGNQVNRQNQNNTQNDTEFFNMFKDTAYKLHPFEKDIPFVYDTASEAFYNTTDAIYKLGEIISTYNTTNPTYNSITQLTSKSDYSKITRSQLTSPTVSYPIAYTTNAVIQTVPATLSRLIVKVSPTPNALNINCLLKPTAPSWSFITGNLGQYLYDSTTSVQFQLDTSEQTNLIIRILKYCGLIINDPEIINVAAQEAQQTSINEKS